ncbi:MAG TPA: sn-glycerol-3-phosphate ABC transporter ATP-binding protein UgpC [Lacipirellulaceae bacterium]|nr:sn-glycerol-3-phosphate ABC transporter ATP-binding protein UgpC [Lacipirellulaceae bacterium]
MANVILKSLNKVYPNGFHAVHNVNLDIADGEFVVLVGPSGCGKSTTLRMVAGLEDISSGQIYIGDRLVNDVAPGDRDIAMVFQNYALYPHMSVYQNMAFGLKMRRTPKAEIQKRVNEAAAILSIESLLDRRPRELSGGQRQRVALGRAIVREPKVFLFDEPLSNLDAKLRVQMRAEIARLHLRLKTTIIYVTHDQVEAMTLGDRIVLMDRGVIQQVDAPMNIYQRPANQFVASFVGSPAMNFIPGRIENGDFRFAHTNGAQAADFSAEPVAIPLDTPLPPGPATLGIRPEDFLVATDGSSVDPHANRLSLPFTTVVLDVVEHMGHETMAHFTLAGCQHVARLPATVRVQPGHCLPLAIRPGALHLFSTSDGQRLN